MLNKLNESQELNISELLDKTAKYINRHGKISTEMLSKLQESLPKGNQASFFLQLLEETFHHKNYVAELMLKINGPKKIYIQTETLIGGRNPQTEITVTDKGNPNAEEFEALYTKDGNALYIGNNPYVFGKRVFAVINNKPQAIGDFKSNSFTSF